KEQSLAVCHDALIRGLEGPAIGRHVIEALPHAILPSKIIRASFFCFPAHRVIPALLEAVHRHDVRRTRLPAPSPLPPIPEAERRVDIDYVVFVSHLPHMIGNSFREFDGAEPKGPLLLRKQVLEKNGLHAVSQVSQDRKSTRLNS